MMNKNLKEFDKWKKEKHIMTCLCDNISQLETGWRAALIWIYYEGVLDSTLAGNLIKEELPDGSV